MLDARPLPDALPIWYPANLSAVFWIGARECSAISTASMILPKAVSFPRSEEHTSELQSLRHLVCLMPVPYPTLFRSGIPPICLRSFGSERANVPQSQRLQ